MIDATLGSLHIPTLVSEDVQYTSVQSPFIIPTMTEEGARANLSSPLSEFNPTLSFGDFFGGEDKEKTQEPKQESKVPARNYTPLIIAGLIGIGLLILIRKGGRS